MKEEDISTLIKYRIEKAETAVEDSRLLPNKLSKDFHKAFEMRQVSDYKTFKPITKEKAEETFNNAVCFVKSVKDYLANPSKDTRENPA